MDKDTVSRISILECPDLITEDWVEEMVLLALQGETHDLAILFTDDAELRAMNNQFRKIDKPTNVLSFPSMHDDPYLGDIAISVERIIEEASAQDKEVKDHMSHIIIHGVLHLRGYDHETSDADAEIMEALEIKLLSSINIKNPYV